MGLILCIFYHNRKFIWWPERWLCGQRLRLPHSLSSLLLSCLGPSWGKDRMNSSMLPSSHSYVHVHIRTHRYRCSHRHTGTHTWRESIFRPGNAQWKSICVVSCGYFIGISILPHVGSGDWTQITGLGYQDHITTTPGELVCHSTTRSVMWISLLSCGSCWAISA